MKREQIRKEVKKIPEKPGVYKFFDAHGNIIYIGKSVNLRQRVSSYFSHNIFNYGINNRNGFHSANKEPDIFFTNKGISNSPGLNTRTRIMINSIERFETDETGSELEALLLEDRLIKEYMPAYNVQQKEFNSYCSINLSNDDFPSLKIENISSNKHSNPNFLLFKNRYRAEEFSGIVSKYTGIRTCADKTPLLHCMNYELSNCSAPCRKCISTEDYLNIVDECRNILSGNTDHIQKKMETTMQKLSAELKFEEAGEVKSDLTIFKKYSSRIKFLRKFVSGITILKEFNKNGLVLLFKNGNLKNIIRNKLKDNDIELILMSEGFNSSIAPKTQFL